jgi:hypothetical protein
MLQLNNLIALLVQSSKSHVAGPMPFPITSRSDAKKQRTFGLKFSKPPGGVQFMDGPYNQWTRIVGGRHMLSHNQKTFNTSNLEYKNICEVNLVGMSNIVWLDTLWS